MGTINHDCLIITTYASDEFNRLKLWIDTHVTESECNLITFFDSPYNGYKNIIVMPSGSKVGWDEYVEAENLIDKLILVINSLEYCDHSSPFAWVKVGYGEYGQKILQGNCKNVFNDKPYATDPDIDKKSE